MTTQQSAEAYHVPEELRMVQRTVADFRDNEILPLEVGMVSDASFLKEEDHKRLGATTRQMGLWCADAPESAGGGGLSYFGAAVMREEMSQHRAGFFVPCYETFGVTPPSIIFDGTANQVNTYARPSVAGERRGYYAITEPSGGTDPQRAVKTTAVRQGDDWVLNGVKTYVMWGMQSDWGIVAARTDPGNPQGLTCFIVETSARGLSREYIPMSIAAPIWPAKITLDNVLVPHRNVLGEVNGGWRLLNEQLLARSRVSFAAGNVGVAVRALQIGTDYAKHRETFGAPLATRQAIQWMLVDSEIAIEAGRWLTWQTAWAIDEGRPFTKEAAIAAVYTSEWVQKISDWNQQIHGGMGVSKWMPFERWYREVPARKIQLGPPELMRMIIAQHILNPQ